MGHLSDQEFNEIFGGSPDEVASSLVEYSRTASLLSSDRPRLLDGHPREWVGIAQNRVAAFGPSMETVMYNLKQSGIAPEDAVIRYIDTEARTLIV